MDRTRLLKSANSQNTIACPGEIRFTNSLPKTRDRAAILVIAYSKAIIYIFTPTHGNTANSDHKISILSNLYMERDCQDLAQRRSIELLRQIIVC
jgi:hypothetical protein